MHMHFIYTLFPFKNITLRMGGSIGSPSLPKRSMAQKKKKPHTHTHTHTHEAIRNSAAMPDCNQTFQDFLWGFRRMQRPCQLWKRSMMQLLKRSLGLAW